MNHPEFAALEVQRRLAAQEAQLTGDDENGATYREWAPRVSEYGLEHRQLNEIRDIEVRRLEFAAGKSLNIPRFPAPRTLIDELLEAHRREDYVEGLALIAPHALPPGAAPPPALD